MEIKVRHCSECSRKLTVFARVLNHAQCHPERHVLRYAKCQGELKVQTKVQYLMKFGVSRPITRQTKAKVCLNISNQLELQVSFATKHSPTYQVLSKKKQRARSRPDECPPIFRCSIRRRPRACARSSRPSSRPAC